MNLQNMNLMKGATSFFGTSRKNEQRRSAIMKDINLLPRAILKQRRFDESYKKICFVLIRVLFLVCAIAILPYILFLSLTFDKNSLERSIDGISQIETLENNVAQARTQLAQKHELVISLNKNDSVISVILSTMEKITPKTMYINSISQETSEVKSDGGKASGMQKSVKINGVSKDKDSIADFQKSLKDSNMYKNVFITNIKESDEQKEGTLKQPFTNEFGDFVDKEITMTLDSRVKVEFDMECILNDWK